MKSFSQGAVVIVDKSRGINCRPATSIAYAQYCAWFGEIEPEQTSGGKGKRRKIEVKMGHAGTLDPMATGCLPVLLGQATKIQDHIPVNVKRYTARLRLGTKTETDDADGKVVKIDEDFKGLALNFNLEPLLQKFRGKISQIPPIYSAINIQGERAYDLARAGKKPEIPAREIEVLSFQASVIDSMTLYLDITCGTGTYIRTLGTDLAKEIGTEGHLIELRRISSGPFSVEEIPRNQDSCDIVQVLTLKEALETFAILLDISKNPHAQENLKTGRAPALFKNLEPLIKLDNGVIEKKIALLAGDVILALVKMNFQSRVCTSICHFKKEDVIPCSSLVHREFTGGSIEEDELRISQFNILADGLAGRRPDLGGFSDTPYACLNWKYRRNRLFQEIISTNPHVIGLQEVDHPDDLKSLFPSRYDSIYITKVNSPALEFSDSSDGCMILFDTDRFRKIQEVSFQINETDNQVVACLIAEEIKTKKILLFSSAHLKASKSPENEVIRTRQIETLMNKLEEISKYYSVTACFVCMDMNANTRGTAYPLAISKMRSALKDLRNGEEPEFTTFKKRGNSIKKETIDYILYTGQCSPNRYLNIPDALAVLPGFHYPSDHIMLTVGFSLLSNL